MLDVDKALINVAACIKAYMIDHRMDSNNTGIMDVTDIDRESGEVIYDGEAVYTYFLSESLPGNITVLYNDGQSEVCNCFKIDEFYVREGTHENIWTDAYVIIKKVVSIPNLDKKLKILDFLGIP